MKDRIQSFVYSVGVGLVMFSYGYWTGHHVAQKMLDGECSEILEKSGTALRNCDSALSECMEEVRALQAVFACPTKANFKVGR